MPLIYFYTEFLGLQVLGTFEGHEGYDGAFLGTPSENWHLEFTVSDEQPDHHPDNDDLLVFYFEAEKAEAITARLRNAGHLPVAAKNPYWNKNGVTFTDPDGFMLVVAVG